MNARSSKQSSDPLTWVDAKDLLEVSDLRNLSYSGSEANFSCFSGNHAHGDSSPSAGMNLITTRWRCRNPSCGLRGNAVDFLIHLKGISRDEALSELRRRYGGEEPTNIGNPLHARLERFRESQTAPEPLRQMISHDEYGVRFFWRLAEGPERYITSRGFTRESLDDWSIGYDPVSKRITIPVYDEHGKLVGIKGRAWNEEQRPRYISIGDPVGRPPRYRFHTYQKSQYVFGLNRATSTRGVIIEGELNVLAMAQMGTEAVAVAGAEFSDRQRHLIVSKFDEVVVYFDWDPAGIAGAKKVAGLLNPYLPVFLVRNAPGDPADAIHPEKKFSPNDLHFLIDQAEPWLTVARSKTMLATKPDAR